MQVSAALRRSRFRQFQTGILDVPADDSSAMPSREGLNCRREVEKGLRDVGRAAVPAQRDPLQGRSARERRSAAAFALGWAHPANHAAAGWTHGTQRLTCAIPLSATAGGAESGKRNDHAHEIPPVLLLVLHCVCQRSEGTSGVRSERIIGRHPCVRAGTSVLKLACYSPGLADASFALRPQA